MLIYRKKSAAVMVRLNRNVSKNNFALEMNQLHKIGNRCFDGFFYEQNNEPRNRPRQNHKDTVLKIHKAPQKHQKIPAVLPNASEALLFW